MADLNSFVWRLLFLMFGIMGLIACFSPLFHAIRLAFEKIFRKVNTALLNKEEKK
jgi:hypothetical protein